MIYRFKYLVILILMGIGVGISPLVISAQVSGGETSPQKDEKKSVEIIIDGKEYASLEEYKIARFKNLLKESFPDYYNDDLNIFFGNLVKNFSSVKLAAIEKDDLQKIIKQFQDQDTAEPTTGRANDAQRPPDDLTEMKELLKEYQSTHQNSPPIEIDSKKIKTIIVAPKK